MQMRLRESLGGGVECGMGCGRGGGGGRRVRVHLSALRDGSSGLRGWRAAS